jgi:hypothetical protein
MGQSPQVLIEPLSCPPRSCPKRIEFGNAILVLSKCGYEKTIGINDTRPWILVTGDPHGDMFNRNMFLNPAE